MQNYQHANRSDSAKAGINRKRIMQQKRHAHAQSSSQPTVNYTSEYDSETSDIAWSNFMTFYEDCQSPTNQPVINTENTRILHNKGNQTRHIISARHKQPHYSSTSGLEKNQLSTHLNILYYIVTRYPIVRPPAIIQFRAALHNDQTFIEIPPFYHEQWAPNYPQEVRFKYNGATYPIRVQQHRGRCFFADGLTDFRVDLKIYESIIINFFACDDNTIFYLHFTPPLNQQTCGRPILHSRQHIWTTEITQWLAQEYWRPRILIEIARVMGTLIALDEFTRSSSFGHFARVLVDIDLLGNMPNEISVERDSYAFFSSINYEKLPLFCNFCNNIGHVVTNYNKKAS
ncbi:hypothetical protein JHK87_012288 [Glycine soja]|nr:hypothetical protein JHK87_012288 [Glycine soja]